MHNLLVTRIGDKKAVLLYADQLWSEPVMVAQYAILEGPPPETDFRASVRHWRIEGEKVTLDTIEGDYVGDLFVVQEPVPKPRGRGPWVYRDGKWLKGR